MSDELFCKHLLAIISQKLFQSDGFTFKLYFSLRISVTTPHISYLNCSICRLTKNWGSLQGLRIIVWLWLLCLLILLLNLRERSLRLPLNVGYARLLLFLISNCVFKSDWHPVGSLRCWHTNWSSIFNQRNGLIHWHDALQVHIVCTFLINCLRKVVGVERCRVSGQRIIGFSTIIVDKRVL